MSTTTKYAKEIKILQQANKLIESLKKQPRNAEDVKDLNKSLNYAQYILRLAIAEETLNYAYKHNESDESVIEKFKGYIFICFYQLKEDYPSNPFTAVAEQLVNNPPLSYNNGKYICIDEVNRVFAILEEDINLLSDYV